MTVLLTRDAIVLSGRCGVEDVEPLALHLEKAPDLPVDIGGATALHTSLWQALMVFQPVIVGTPLSAFAADTVLPALKAHAKKSMPD